MKGMFMRPGVSCRVPAMLCFVLTVSGCQRDNPEEVPASTRSTENPGGSPGDSNEPTIVIKSIQAAPSSGTDCQLPPGSPIVDAFGVPNGDFIEAAIIFPQVFKSTKEFGVVAEDPGIAWTSKTETGLHEKITLTIKKDERLSSSFFIQGKSVDKTKLIVDSVVDDAETPDNKDDDVTYNFRRFPVVVWDVRQEDIVDYNARGDASNYCYDVQNSPALVIDSSVRTSCGERVDAVAADGVTYQLVRLRSGDYGKACFTVLKDSSSHGSDPAYLGSFSDPLSGRLGESPAGNVATTFQFQQEGETASQHWALGTYSPPTDFFNTEDKERTVTIEIQFIPQDENGQLLRSNVTAKKKEIKIRRSPVLLVHGLWSSAETWGAKFRKPQLSAGRRVDSAFSFANDIPFSTTGPTLNLKYRIDQLVKDSRELDGVATTKVDLIAHSMGGLRARRWISDEIYRSPENFNEGNVRKLAALTTPHLGSPLANMLINLHQRLTDPETHEVHEANLAWFESLLPGGIHNGAVCELADNNPALVSGQTSGARAISFTATDGHRDDWAFLLDLSLAVVLGPEIKRDHADPYIFHSENDKIVDLVSQEGGLPVAMNFPAKAHLNLQVFPNGVTGASEVAGEIYKTLDLDSGWIDTLPARTIEPIGVIPRDNRGRGVDGSGNFIDAFNYREQCPPGGPMNIFGN